MSARDMADQFRIWAYATPLGWDVTPRQAAEDLGMPARRLRRLVREKGWSDRLRTVRLDSPQTKTFHSGMWQDTNHDHDTVRSVAGQTAAAYL
jgi:hypothetical protein